MPVGVDWLTISPAVDLFLQGQSPYLLTEGWRRTLFPFWTYLLLLPFEILPFWVGRCLLFVVSLTAFAYTAIRMKASHWQLVLFLTSSAVIGCLNNGNIDWLVTLGLWMQPQAGLFFVLIKPQIGVPIALYWAYILWQLHGWKGVAKAFAPVTVAYLTSFLLYGFWIKHMLGMQNNPENMSGFPFTVPVGLFLLYIALRNKEGNLSVFSGPLLAPYTSQFSYAAPLLALMHRPRLFVLAWVLLWIPVLVRVFM